MNNIEMDFEQKRFLNRKRFKIRNNGVECNNLQVIQESTYLIPFEEIMDSPVEWTVFSKMWLVLMTMSLLLEFFIAFDHFFLKKDFYFELFKWTGIFAIICIVNFLATYNKLVYYSLGKRFQLVFFKEQPEKTALNDFMSKVFESRNMYLGQNHDAGINNNQEKKEFFSIPDEIYRLSKLLEQGIINESEFIDAKKAIIGNDKTPERRIGF